MLIIVESPAKAKTIAKIVGSKHTVKASVGHIRQLSDQKKTEDGRSLEISGIDIDRDFNPIYQIDDDKKTVVSDLKKLAKSAKDGILFATDSDREGEAISWHLAEVLGVKDISKVQRLEFHEITKRAIDEAMAHPRDLNVALVSAQQARQVLDKLVGFKLSPVLWNTMGNFRLSAGRVQSPALHLICLREAEIEIFVPQEYWEIQGLFKNESIEKAKEIFKKTEADKEDDKNDEQDKDDISQKIIRLRPTLIKGNKLPKEITTETELQKIISNLAEFPKFTVKNVSERTEQTSPRPPFTTSTLQQAASSALGFTPKITMQLAQKLYEGVDINGVPTALITYMRTDSLNLSSESVASARTFIQKKYPKSLPEKPNYYKSKSRNAQEAHEAIRPTDPGLTPQEVQGKLDARQWKLYDLIWRQMIASQMTPEIRQRLSFDLQNERIDQFSGSVAWTTHPGFKALTGEKMVMENTLQIKVGQVLFAHEFLYSQHFTKPPSRYSAASLIKKLEELGIGRPSTYASIISTLQDRGYVEDQNKQMVPTTLGRKINDILSENFELVTSSDLTAQMEERLDEISRGEKSYNQVLQDFWWNFKKEVEEKSKHIVEDKTKYRTTETDQLCPTCEGKMELKLGRFGEYYQCQNHKEHQFPKNFKEYQIALDKARVEFAKQAHGKKCEVCKKDLIIRVSKSSLKPYIACPDYQVGNKHTVLPINLGPCPKCIAEGRAGKKQGVLVQKKGFRGRSFVGCSLPKEVCGYVQKEQAKEPVDA